MVTWLQVIDYEGLYDVSSLGQVRRAINAPRTNGTHSGRMLRPHTAGRYPTVNLCCSRIQKTRKVHKLVADAFLGQCPEGLEVNHIDGDTGNNRVDNLEYVTSSENQQYSYQLGLRARLSTAKIAKIRIRRGWAKWTFRQIAAEAGISESYASLIASGHRRRTG